VIAPCAEELSEQLIRNESEERVNVDRRWSRTSVVRSRILATGLVLLGAGCAVLGWGARPRQIMAANSAAMPASDGYAQITPSPFLGPNVPAAAGNPQLQAHSLFSGLPLMFEPNQGQGNLDPADGRAKFVAHGSGYGLFLGTQGATLTLASRNHSKQTSSMRLETLEMKLAGANPSLSLTAIDRLPGTSNYFIGNNPSKWRAGIPQFARVRYENVYPGINLVFYGNQGQLEYDFQVAPGADPAQPELEFKGAKGLELRDGALLIKSEGGNLQLQAPRVYQEIGGRQKAVEGSFVLRGGNRAGFAIGYYDRSRELVIDPILTFSTYFGGGGDEHATSVAVDGSFNIYLAGSTTSTDLPTVTGVYQPALKGLGPDVYIAKITPPLGSLVAALDYVTYLGGSGQDTPAGIKVDGAGHPFVAGTTSSGDFPTTATNAYQTSPESPGNQHVFVTELQNDGTALLYSSYLSGNGTDLASGMTIDAGGNLYVTGTTTSVETSSTDQFPASNLPQGLPFQAASRVPGLPQFFVTKVNTTAPKNGSITYSTYFGGGTFDTSAPVAIGGGIAVDTSNNVYFTGTTNFLYAGCSGCSTTDFPILNAYQPCLDQAPPTTIVNPATCSTSTTTTASDAFVAKLNLNPNVPQGQQLVWSTYLGGTGTDAGAGIALDAGAANVFVVGTTNSTDIATGVTTLSTSSSFQRCLDTPLNPAAGTTCPTPSTLANDAFAARLTNPSSSTSTTAVNVTLSYFSYLGGSGAEAGQAIAVDSASGALVTGWTQSSDFPVLPASSSIQSNYGGSQDAFVARLNTAAIVGQTTSASWSSYFGGSGTDSGTGIALDVNQNVYLAGETNSTDLQVAKQLTTAQGGGYNGGYDAFVTQLGTALSLSIQGALTQGTNQQYISAGNQATFTYTVTNNGPDLANNVTIIDNLSSSVTGVPLTFNSASVTSGTCGGVSTNAIVSCTLPSLQAGSTATVTIVVTPTGTATGNPQTFNGGTVQAMGPGNIVLAQVSVPAQMSDFSMTVAPFSQSVPAAGFPATYKVTLSPHPLFSSGITVSCSNLPTASSCVLTPSTITLQSTSGGTVTLAITTTARPVTPAASLYKRSFYALAFAIPGLFVMGFAGDRRRRRVAGFLMLCALFAMLLLVPACSHSTTQTPVSGTPSGNYNITVTASSGADSKTQTIGLFVP